MMLLEARGLAKTVGHRVLFERLDLSVAAGELVVLRGANGSGKSTLLRALAGRIALDRGTISFAGRPPPEEPWRREEEAPFVDQEPELELDVPAIDNLIDTLELGASWHRWLPLSRARARSLAKASTARDAERFGLSDALEQPARALSHGQRRLLTVLRALRPLSGGAPRLLLLDEPLAGLSAALATAVLDTIAERLARGWGAIIAEHLSLNGRVVELDRRE